MGKTTEFAGMSLSAEGKDSVAHYNGNAWGIYLLTIPLITGDTEKAKETMNPPISFSFTFLKDTVNLESVSKMVSEVAEADGCTTLEDVNSHRLSLLSMFPIPIFYFKFVTVTANGVK